MGIGLKLAPTAFDMICRQVDEADRLLSQSYYQWVTKVYAAAYGREKGVVVSE